MKKFVITVVASLVLIVLWLSLSLRTTNVKLFEANKMVQEQNTKINSYLTTISEQNKSIEENIRTIQNQETKIQKITGEVDSAQKELSSTKISLYQTQSSLSTTQSSLTKVQKELDSTVDTLNLYKNTWGSAVASGINPPFAASGNIYSKVSLTNNVTSNNTDIRSLKNFIFQDKTDEKEYITGIYMCGEFAREVHNNAEKQGIRCAWIAIKLDNGKYHALNAFETTDQGLIFIDCTGRTKVMEGPRNQDTVAEVKKGQVYKPIFMFSTDWQCGEMGLIEDVEVYW